MSRILRTLSLAAASLTLSLPAHADAVDDAVTRLLGNVLTEQNVSLIFGLMRQSLAAGADGKPAPELSAEARAQFEATGKTLQREMFSVSALVLDQVEKELRETVRSELGRPTTP